MSELLKQVVGGWTLVSSTIVFEDGTVMDMHGPNPQGSVVFTGKRMTALITHSTRPPRSDASLADLFKTMLAYSGYYTIQGGELVTTVDAAWVPEWVGTVQKRFVAIEGDTLFIRTASGPHPLYQGKIVTGTLTWQRDQ